MTQTLNDTLIQGTADVTQLTVQGYSSQTQPLQEWQNSGGTALMRVTADGRLQLGSNFGGAADALLQVNYLPSGAMPTSVWHAPGTVSNAGTAVNWVFHELQVSGTAAFSGLHNGLYTRLTHNNTGSAGAAELRAATFQAINQSGSASIPVGQLTGLRATASNAGTAFLNRAVGVEATVTNDTAGSISQAVAFSVAAPTNAGTIASLYGLQIPDLTAGTANNYAIYTGLGPVRLGDALSVAGTATVGGFKLATGAVVGRVLTSDANGVGTWQPSSGGGGGISSYPCNGRLTLSSGVPVTTADVTAATTLYFTPYQGDQLALYNGSAWVAYTLSEVSLALGSLAANTDYDLFIYDNTGTLTLEAVAWTAPTSAAVTSISNASPRVVSTGTTPTTGQLVTISGNSVSANNATWRVGTVVTNTSFQLLNLDNTNSSAPGSVGTGGTWQRADQNVARVTSLATQNGVYVKSGAPTHRYIGTIRVTRTAGQGEDSAQRRFVYNYANPWPRRLNKALSVSSYTCSNTSWAAANNDFGNRVEFVCGIAQVPVSTEWTALIQSASGIVSYAMSFGLDGSTTDSGDIHGAAANAQFSSPVADYENEPGLGYHYLQMIEIVTSGTSTVRGTNLNTKAGLKGRIFG